MSASAAGPCGFSLLLFFVFAAAEQLDDCPELPQWDTTVTERKTLRVSWTPRTPIGAEDEGLCFCYPVLPDESENIACSLGTTSSNVSCWNATEGTNSIEVPLNGDSSGSICMLSGCGRSECTPIELPDTSTEAYVEVVFVNSTTITFSWNNSYDTEGDINYFVVRWCVQENECFDDTSWLGNCSRTGDTKTQDYTYTVNNLSVGENVRLMVAAVTPLENEGVQLGPPLIGCFQTFPTELETVTDLRGYPVDPNGISLTWEKSGQARDVLSGYFVHWCVEENTSCAEAEKNANRCSDYSWKVVKDTALNTTNIPVNSALFVRISPTFDLPGSTQRSSHETKTCFDSRQTSELIARFNNYRFSMKYLFKSLVKNLRG